MAVDGTSKYDQLPNSMASELFIAYAATESQLLLACHDNLRLVLLLDRQAAIMNFVWRSRFVPSRRNAISDELTALHGHQSASQ